MKKITLLACSLLVSGVTFGQGTELFFSELIEGAGPGNNDKAIEVFNPTLNTVDISQYSIRRYSNGNSNPSEDERLMPTSGNTNLASQDVYVLVNSDPAISPVIAAAADQVTAPYQAGAGGNVITGGGAMYANGDDALVLVRWVGGTPGSPSASPVIVDIIGKIGEQPPLGNGWSGVQAGTVTTIGTANHSIIRKDTISSGVSTNPATFDITQEWFAYSSAFDPAGQDYSRLGEHADYNGPSGNYTTVMGLAEFTSSISMFPNPATDVVRIQLAENNVGSVSLVNNLGQQLVTTNSNLGSNIIEINTSNLASGLYFVKFTSKNGQMGFYKELIVK